MSVEQHLAALARSLIPGIIAADPSLIHKPAHVAGLACRMSRELDEHIRRNFSIENSVESMAATIRSLRQEVSELRKSQAGGAR